MYPLVKTFRSLIKAHLIDLMIACAFLALIVVLTMVGLITWISASLVTLEPRWLDMLVNFIIGGLTGIGGWFMLPALTVFIAGMFQEKAIQRIERIYYPQAMRKEGPRFWPDLIHDIKFTLWALFLNMLVLPLYLFGIGYIISITLNSYLIGREFFESAAGHHIGKPHAKDLGKQHKIIIYGSGFFFTLMTLIPLLNLFVPIIAIVWMVHVYHRINPKEGTH
ncbi:MAG: EI24 domain-containing protein [bacterium]